MCLTKLLENEEKTLDFCEKFDLVLVILLAALRNSVVEIGIVFSTTQCFQLSSASLYHSIPCGYLHFSFVNKREYLSGNV